MHQQYSNLDSKTNDNYVGKVVCDHKIHVSSYGLHTLINALLVHLEGMRHYAKVFIILWLLLLINLYMVPKKWQCYGMFSGPFSHNKINNSLPASYSKHISIKEEDIHDKYLLVWQHLIKSCKHMLSHLTIYVVNKHDEHKYSCSDCTTFMVNTTKIC